METLFITLQEVETTAGKLRQQNTQLRSILKEISTSITQLTSVWQSPASQTMQAKFQTMLPIFDQYKTIIDNYAKFLDQTVFTYQNMEQQLNVNADSF